MKLIIRTNRKGYCRIAQTKGKTYVLFFARKCNKKDERKEMSILEYNVQ